MSPKGSDPLPPPPPQPPQFEELLRLKAPRFGLSSTLSGEAFGVLSRYLAELSRWQRSMNLTGRLTLADLTDHTLESALGEQLIVHGARLIDIGSGAGLPGVPLAIVRSDLEVRLLEPRTKRGAFLRHVIRALGLSNVEVIHGRLEDVEARVGGQTFDAATVRAVNVSADGRFPPRLLKSGGQFLAWTTCAPAAPQSLAQWLGGSWRLERTLPIPGSVSRCIASFRAH